MSHQNWNEKKLTRLAEMIGEVDNSEQVARETSEFATKVAEKWQDRIKNKQSVS